MPAPANTGGREESGTIIQGITGCEVTDAGTESGCVCVFRPRENILSPPQLVFIGFSQQNNFHLN